MDDCNHLTQGVYYQLTRSTGYCLDSPTSDPLITFLNLSNQRIETANIEREVSYLYPNEYVFLVPLVEL